jgi:hypothetical protein
MFSLENNEHIFFIPISLFSIVNIYSLKNMKTTALEYEVVI